MACFLNENRKKNRYLVVARVGDSSLHHQWLTPSQYKNFDLYLEYYGDQNGRYKEDCDYYSQGKATKWPRLYQLIKTEAPRIFQYDAIWLPDDDVSINCEQIERMFDLFLQHNLMLAQPGLTLDSHLNHIITLRKPQYVMRYTNFVECMAPVFSSQALQICWQTFNKSRTGWGLDYIWPKLLGDPSDKIAIMDAIPMKHTRKSGHGTLYSDTGLSPELIGPIELLALTAMYQIDFLTFEQKEYGRI